MGFLDRLKPGGSHDEESVQRMLEWLSHPDKAHGVPDPDAEETWVAVLNWTPVNAISAGKTQLVLDEARRYAAG